MNIGSLVRASELTGYYSHRLLYDYMFRDSLNRDELAKKAADRLLHTFPSHGFVIDYHMGAAYCELPLDEMKQNEFDKTRGLVEALSHLAEQGVICPDIGVDDRDETIKATFLRLYSR